MRYVILDKLLFPEFLLFLLQKNYLLIFLSHVQIITKLRKEKDSVQWTQLQLYTPKSDKDGDKPGLISGKRQKVWTEFLENSEEKEYMLEMFS